MATKITITADGAQAKQELNAVAGAVDGVGNKAATAATKTQGMASATAAAGTAAKAAQASFGWIAVVGTAVATLIQWFSRAKESVTKLGEMGQIAFGNIAEAARSATDATRELQAQNSIYAATLKELNEGIDKYVEASNAEANAAREKAEYEERVASGRATVADRRRQELEVILQRIRLDKQSAEAGKIEGEIEKSRQAEAHQRLLSQITDRQQILSLLQQETAATKKLADQGKLTAEEAVAARRRVSDLLSREKELVRDAESARNKAIEERKKKEEDARRDHIEKIKKAQEEEIELYKKVIEERLEAERKAAEERVRLEKETQARIIAAKEEAQAEARKRLQGAVEGSGALKELEKRVNDPEALAKQLADQRASKVRFNSQQESDLEKLKAKQVSEGTLAQQLAASGNEDEAMNAQIRSQEAGNEIKRMQAQLEREREQVRRQAFRDARRQQQGGREAFSGEEIAKAQADNTQAQLTALQQNGQVSGQTLEVLQTAIREAQAQGTELRLQADLLKELQKAMNNTAQDGQRRRSQRNSNRQ